MLIANRIWDVSLVPLGLMNGARGIVVAIVYVPQGQNRKDGISLAGVGFPSGKRHCPLPDFVVVHFPGYTGPALFLGLPRTWGSESGQSESKSCKGPGFSVRGLDAGHDLGAYGLSQLATVW